MLRAAIAAGLYLLLAVWSLRVLLPSPSTMTTLPTFITPNAIGDADISVMIWSTTRNARILATHPFRLQEFETCWPTPQGSGFGAPYFADGLMALPAHLLGAPPILTYNSVVLAAIWIAALAMFLLVHYWTGDFAAALLAGIAFGFHPQRILGAHWPHVYGNEWTPLVVLFTHRLFARERWRDAVFLATFLSLQVLGCFYQFLPLVVIEGVYVLALAFRYRARLVALVPKLLVVGIAAVASGALQFLPALHAQHAWGTLTGRINLPLPISRLYPGGAANPGIVVLVLAAVALLDRIRTQRTAPPDDPRLVMLVAGLLVVWTIVFYVPIPGTTMWIPSLLALVGSSIPGLGSALAAVRGIQFGVMGVYVSSALLAGFGLAVLRRGRGGAASRLLAIGFVAAILAETYVPALAVGSFSSSVELVAHVRGLDPAVTDLERRVLRGPVLDLPAGVGGIQTLFPSSRAIMLAAFHEQPVAACYNSFTSPLSAEIADIAGRLPEVRAAEDLRAIGFEYVVVHGDLLGPFTEPTLIRLRRLESIGRLAEVAAAPDHWIFQLRSPRTVTTTLPPSVEASPPQDVQGPSADVAFPFRNDGEQTYRHPDPIEPSDVVVRWHDASGALAGEERTRLLLPIALAPEEDLRRTLRLSVPAAPGAYRVTLARAAAAGVVIAVAHVQVGAP